MKKQTSFFHFTYALLLMLILGFQHQSTACPLSFVTLTYTFTTATAGSTVEVTWVSDCPTTLMEVNIVNVANNTIQQFYPNVPNSGSYFFAINSNIIPGPSFFLVRDMDNVIWNTGLIFELMAPLPIELIHFNGTLEKDNSVKLNWSTASELNNSGFEIERSVNGDDWSEINFVEGHGTSTAINHYEYIDRSAKPGANYYRLKQLDFDGHFEYFKIVHVFVPSRLVNLRISPNPTSDVLYVSFDQPVEHNIIIELVGLDGRTIQRQELSAGEKQYAIDCHHIPGGVYFLKLMRDGVPVRNEKFLKQ